MDTRPDVGEPARGEVGSDTALASFVVLAAFLQRPVDPAQLRHAIGKGSVPFDEEDLLRVAKMLDLRAKDVPAPASRLQRQPLPAIAWTGDRKYFLILQATDETALVFHPGSTRPQSVPISELAEDYAGRLILVSSSERLAGAARAFDLTWFIPALVKYRHLFRDVLLASFEASITYSLQAAANVETLKLTGLENIDATGSASGDVLHGNSGNNRIDGLGGADTMAGGAGNDVYVVDNVADVVTENASAGADTIESSTSFNISSNVENVTLTGSGNINSIGNSLNNIMTGNSGDNNLQGGTGNDQVNGGAGNDTINGGDGDDAHNGGDGDDLLVANTGLDTFDGGNGVDTLDYTFFSGASTINLATGVVDNVTAQETVVNVENAWAGSGSVTMIGTSANNYLRGGSGVNTLTGSGGNDVLEGGLGADVYRFDTGFGVDLIEENGQDGTTQIDRIEFVSYNSTDLTFSLANGALDLVITVAGTGDSVTVRNNFATARQDWVDQVRFADGTTWNRAAIAAAVGLQTMAFGVDASGAHEREGLRDITAATVVGQRGGSVGLAGDEARPRAGSMRGVRTIFGRPEREAGSRVLGRIQPFFGAQMVERSGSVNRDWRPDHDAAVTAASSIDAFGVMVDAGTAGDKARGMYGEPQLEDGFVIFREPAAGVVERGNPFDETIAMNGQPERASEGVSAASATELINVIARKRPAVLWRVCERAQIVREATFPEAAASHPAVQQTKPGETPTICDGRMLQMIDAMAGFSPTVMGAVSTRSEAVYPMSLPQLMVDLRAA